MGITPGEAGGTLAGIVALLALFGGGLKWLFGFIASRNDVTVSSRTAKLEAWHQELNEREADFEARQKEYHERIEMRLTQVEAANRVLLRAVEMLSASLRVIKPDDAVLAQVTTMLETAFPVDMTLPEGMRSQLAAIRESRPKREPNGGHANGRV